MLQWLLAIVAVLVVGGAATWVAHGPLRRRDVTRAGIAALSAMSWREFIRVVLEAFSRRGYERLVDHEAASGDDEHTLVRDGGHWLLSAKHGSAFVLGRATVIELSTAMGVAGASGGLLVTQGRIDGEARQAARGQPIELLDGASLWPELRPLLPAAVVAPIEEAASRRARERSLGGWLLALVVGVAVFSLLPQPRQSPPPAEAASAAPAPAPATAGIAVAAAPTPVADPDARTLQLQRAELAAAVATLPMVARAFWSSSSTLEIAIADTGEDPVPSICPLVEHYPALAASRLQLTPPPGSDRPIRFRQCRSY